MQAGPKQDTRLIAWNGIRLRTPRSWDSRISGSQQIVFEKDFQPLLQIRWENTDRRTPKSLKISATKFVAKLGSIIPNTKVPRGLQPLSFRFGDVSFFRDESGLVSGGICLCPECPTLLLFQLLAKETTPLEEIVRCLRTFSCHEHTEKLWRVQDFSLITPDSFRLHNYSFQAGLTRISFNRPDLHLQTCRLGPGDKRLAQNSLEEILLTLAGCTDLQIVSDEKNKLSKGERSPSIFGQILFRLRREKPFITAKIWYDAKSNRLLSVILSANRPIPQDILENICKQYEII